MKRLTAFAIAACAFYLASGFYVVRGNEKAAVRLLGRAIRTPEGRLRLESSGLHYGLPWPWTQIDRLNLNEVRNLSLGVDNLPESATGDFLQYVETVGRSQYLTGDKNILHLKINTQYRVSERATDDFLFRSAFPERHLERIVESVATDLLARSGVDFVHPLGQVELNRLLIEGVRRLVDEEGLGIEIDDVAINAVSPPLVVKSYFLDVTSARADRVNSINQGKAYAEQRRAAATGEVRRIADEAAGYRQQAIESARGQADSFTRMVEQLRSEAQSDKRSYAQARQIVMQRYYLETMRDILKTVSAKVLLDSHEPADLTIFGRPEAVKPPQTP